MSRGVCVVIIGVAGSGKTTIGRRLVEVIPNSVAMKTFTTRKPRPGEKKDGDRIFISQKEFLERREAGEFIEWDEHFNHLYGSSLNVLNELLDKYQVVIVNVNFIGAREYQKKIPEVVTIFLSVPENQIKSRLARRKNLSSEEMEKRLMAMKTELASASEFDFVVENLDGQLDKTIDDICQIVKNKLDRSA